MYTCIDSILLTYMHTCIHKCTHTHINPNSWSTLRILICLGTPTFDATEKDLDLLFFKVLGLIRLIK